jgi:hypothetical protein
MFHTEPHSGQVDGDDAVPILFAAFGRLRQIPLNASIVKRTVQPTIGLHRQLDHSLNFVSLRDIRLHKHGRAAGGLNHLHSLFASNNRYIGNDNPGPFPSKGQSCGSANTRGASGHQRYFLIQLTCHNLPSSLWFSRDVRRAEGHTSSKIVIPQESRRNENCEFTGSRAAQTPFVI